MNNTTSEIVFLIEEDLESGYVATALGEAIFTQASDMTILKEMVRDAVRCHFPAFTTNPNAVTSLSSANAWR
ncbi:MAG: 2-oxoisovalerate dehydrogenase E1 subunit beta [Nostochopsis sp.]